MNWTRTSETSRLRMLPGNEVTLVLTGAVQVSAAVQDPAGRHTATILFADGSQPSADVLVDNLRLLPVVHDALRSGDAIWAAVVWSWGETRRGVLTDCSALD